MLRMYPSLLPWCFQLLGATALFRRRNLISYGCCPCTFHEVYPPTSKGPSSWKVIDWDQSFRPAPPAPARGERVFSMKASAEKGKGLREGDTKPPPVPHSVVYTVLIEQFPPSFRLPLPAFPLKQSVFTLLLRPHSLFLSFIGFDQRDAADSIHSLRLESASMPLSLILAEMRWRSHRGDGRVH